MRYEEVLRVRRRIGKKGREGEVGKGKGERGSKRVCRVRYEEVLRVRRRIGKKGREGEEGKGGERQ